MKLTNVHLHPPPHPLRIQSSTQSSQDRLPWPQEFTIPTLSPEIKMVLKKAIEAYRKDGSLLNVQTVKRDVNEHLVKAIYTYTSYPKISMLKRTR